MLRRRYGQRLVAMIGVGLHAACAAPSPRPAAPVSTPVPTPVALPVALPPVKEARPCDGRLVDDGLRLGRERFALSWDGPVDSGLLDALDARAGGQPGVFALEADGDVSWAIVTRALYALGLVGYTGVRVGVGNDVPVLFDLPDLMTAGGDICPRLWVELDADGVVARAGFIEHGCGEGSAIRQLPVEDPAAWPSAPVALVGAAPGTPLTAVLARARAMRVAGFALLWPFLAEAPTAGQGEVIQGE